MSRQLLLLACSIALVASGCSGMKTKHPIQAVLVPTAGNNAAGTLEFTTQPDGVRIRGQIAGLAPGSSHGFHINEHGDCISRDAISSGGHFNPAGSEHGDPVGLVHHAGDIANQVADAQGAVDVDATVHGVSVDTGDSDDALGRALVLDAGPDDYTTQPDGNAGPHIACGVILRKP